MTDFEKRRLGRSALEVTALGLGCATLGGSRVPVSREEAESDCARGLGGLSTLCGHRALLRVWAGGALCRRRAA